MDIAQTSEGRYVRASDIVQLGLVQSAKKWYCPHCKQAVFFKMGPQTRPHFAHFHQKVDHRGMGESALHQEAKFLIAQQLQSEHFTCQLEYPIEDKARRADVFVNQQSGIAEDLTIEIQYSPIAGKAVVARQVDYGIFGIAVVWLLGYQSDYASIFKSPKGVNPKASVVNRLRPFIIQIPDFGLCLPYWYEDKQCVMLVHIDVYGKAVRKMMMKVPKYITDFYFQSKTAAADNQGIKIETTSLPKNVHRFIQSILVSPNQYEKRLLDFLYLHSKYIQHFNHRIFSYRHQAIFAKHVDWHFLVIYQVLAEQGQTLTEILSYMYDHECFYDQAPFTKEMFQTYIQALIDHYDLS